MPLPAAVALVIVLGMLLGLVNGLLSTYGKIPSFIVTLATMNVYRGAAYLITKALTIFSVSPHLELIFYGRLLGIPMPFYYVVILYGLAALFLRHTVAGRFIYAVGGNESASRLSGIPDTFVYSNTTLPDSAILVARFANGAIGGIGGGCTSEQRVTREYLDLHFQNGIAQVFGMLDQPYHVRILMRDEPVAEEHEYPGSDGIREEVRHFVDCVRENREPACTGGDGRKALAIALATLESIQAHRPVAVPD